MCWRKGYSLSFYCYLFRYCVDNTSTRRFVFRELLEDCCLFFSTRRAEPFDWDYIPRYVISEDTYLLCIYQRFA